MGVKEFLDYEQYILYMDKQLEIFGQPCTIYVPERKIVLGYEDTTYNEIDKMNSDKVLGNKYSKFEARIWINFTVSKSTYYKHSWFPDEGEELCSAFIKSDSLLKEDCYVRTAIPGATSIWGDMIFSVRKILDDGLANVLKRTYLLKPTNNADLHCELDF